MLQLIMNGKTYELATSLRVAYALKDMTKAKSLQDAINSIQTLDLDGQLELIYAAYKAGGGKNDKETTKEKFINEFLDTQGIFVSSNLINDIVEGLLYSGLSPEEAASKKAEVEGTVSAGAISSAKGTD